MAVHERSLGPLYLAKVRTEPIIVPIHTVGVTQMHPPWRVGRATVLPIWRHVGLVIGWWKKTMDDVEIDFSDVRWIDPHWTDHSTEEISTWHAGDELDPEEVEAQA
jgi:hypothetical protein